VLNCNDRKLFSIDLALTKLKDLDKEKGPFVVEYLIVKFLAHFVQS
jgi:hypothetical protein